jgi:hypothetical protein
LYVAEIYSLIQQVTGVKHVLEVQLSQRRLIPGKEPLAQEVSVQEETPAEDTLTPVTGRVLQVPDDTLLCSLDHEIKIVDL